MMRSCSKVPLPAYLLRHTKPRSHRSSTFMRARAERINSAAPRASLLGIPGELRNRISRLVLVEDDAIEITATDNHEQPGMLRACRQLRAETRSIFELENDFGLEVLNVRPRIPLKYGLHWSGPLITHGYFTNTMPDCKWSCRTMMCVLAHNCNEGMELAEKWEERRGDDAFGFSEETHDKVGWCFHSSMASVLQTSAEAPHPRVKMPLCRSLPTVTDEQLRYWMKIFTDSTSRSPLRSAIQAQRASDLRSISYI